ncbi:MAG: hypothetical protein WCW32_02905 [Candidatus Paceibacterota bacterium]
MSQRRFEQLFAQQSGKIPIYRDPDPLTRRLYIFEDWSFFRIRGTADQCLEHIPAARDSSLPLKIEIYAPIFLQLLRLHGQFPEIAEKVVSCDNKDLLIILLNPTGLTYLGMEKPIKQLRSATFTAVVERARVQNLSRNLDEARQRADYLDEELPAWRELMSDGYPVVECIYWPYFEFSYGSGDLARARVQLMTARQYIIDCIRKQYPHKLAEFLDIIRTPMEISKLACI